MKMTFHGRIAETGEEVELQAQIPDPQRRPKIRRPFVMIFADMLEHLAATSALHATEYRILYKLLASVQFENQVPMTQADVARSLGITKAQVSTAYQRLLALKLIEMDRQIGNAKLYRISTDLAWKGSAKTYHGNHAAQAQQMIAELRKTEANREFA